MNIDQVNIAIKRAKPGLDKYLLIMEKFKQVDVSKDIDFQRMYNGFYRVRQRNDEFYKAYYSYMEANKNTEPSFEDSLMHFFSELGRVEASFSSKLIATINPNLPIWDSMVINNLNLKKPKAYSKNRIRETIDMYNEIVKWYENLIVSNTGIEVIELFDKSYPTARITSIKKIDFVLWQMRE